MKISLSFITLKRFFYSPVTRAWRSAGIHTIVSLGSGCGVRCIYRVLMPQMWFRLEIDRRMRRQIIRESTGEESVPGNANMTMSRAARMSPCPGTISPPILANLAKYTDYGKEGLQLAMSSGLCRLSTADVLPRQRRPTHTMVCPSLFETAPIVPLKNLIERRSLG